MNLISPSELSYTTTALLAGRRGDGRSLLAFRDIHLATNVIAQSAGSARVSCAGTDVIVGIRLETVDGHEERVNTSVEVAPAALQNLPSDPTLSLLSHISSLTSSIASHPQLTILPTRKYWALHISISVLSTSGGGNVHDVANMAVRSALQSLRIPRTRSIKFAKSSSGGKKQDAGDAIQDESENQSGMEALLKGKKAALDVRANRASAKNGAAEFELLDFEADAGDFLTDRDDLPCSITLNLTPEAYKPFLDATLFESLSSPIRLVCTFDGKGNLRAIAQETPEGSVAQGTSELPYDKVDSLIDTAAELCAALSSSLNERIRDPKTSSGGVRLGTYP